MNDDTLRDIAMDAYWRSDPSDVSVNAVCRMAGVSKPSLYRAFGSEDGLMRAALDRYAELVLADIFEILNAGWDLQSTLIALIEFASSDVRMEAGCLFYKMRAGKHRLGPQTRQRVNEIEAVANAAYAAFLESRRVIGEWSAPMPPDTGANYLGEQLGLAFMQRASGEDPQRIREMLQMAFSAIT